MALDEAKFQKLTRMLADVDDGTATMDPEVEQRARAAVSEYAQATEPSPAQNLTGPEGWAPPEAVPSPLLEPGQYRSRFPADGTLSRFVEKTFGIPPDGMSQEEYRAELAQGDPLEQQAARDLAQGDVDAGRALNALDGAGFMMGVPLARMALSGMGMPEAAANLERLQGLDPHPVLSSLAGGLLTGGAVAKGLGMLSTTGSAATSVGLPEVLKAGGIGAVLSGLTHYGSGLADFGADAAEGSPETLEQRLATLKDSLFSPLGPLTIGGGLGIAGATFGALASANRNPRTPQGIATRLNEDLGGTANRPSPAAASVIDDLGGQPGLTALDRAVEAARAPIAKAQAEAEGGRVRTVENFKADYAETPQGQQRQIPHSTVRGLVEDLEGRVYDPAEGGGALGGVNNAPLVDLVRQQSKMSVVDGPTAKRMLQQDPKLIQLPLEKAQQLGLVRHGDQVRTPVARPPSVDMAMDPGLPPMVQERLKWLGEEIIQLNRRLEIEMQQNPGPAAQELVIGPIKQKLDAAIAEAQQLQAGSAPPAGTPRYGAVPDGPMATQPSAPDRSSMWAFDEKSSNVPDLDPTVVIHPKGVTAGELETIREAADRAAQLDRRQAGDVERWRVRRAADIRRDRLGYGSNEQTSWVDPVKIEVGGKVEVLPQGSYAAAMHRMGEMLDSVQNRGVQLGMRPGADPTSAETLKAVGNEISGSYSGRSGRIDPEQAVNRLLGEYPELQPLMDTVRGVNAFTAMKGSQLTPGQVVAPFSTAPRLDAMRRFLDPVWRLGQDALSIGAITQTPGVDARSEAKKTYDGLKMLRSTLTGGSP